MKRFALGSACALLLSTPALASDLEGTWVGTVRCVEVLAVGGLSDQKNTQSTLEVTQVDTVGAVAVLNVRIDGVPYSARAIETGSSGRKGLGVSARCGGNDDAWAGRTALVELIYRVNEASGKGSIRMLGVSNDAFETDAGGRIGACKGRWKRVSTADPEVPGCEE